MEGILSNKKYIIAGVLILIAFIILIVYLFFLRKKYNIDGKYYLHPMRFIECEIKPGNSKDKFNITFDLHRNLLTSADIKDLNEKHPNISSRTAQIKMIGESNQLGNELIYIENGNNYKGIQINQDYNLYAKKDDIIITTNDENRESIVFKRK
jgi:hypothetical protein